MRESKRQKLIRQTVSLMEHAFTDAVNCVDHLNRLQKGAAKHNPHRSRRIQAEINKYKAGLELWVVDHPNIDIKTMSRGEIIAALFIRNLPKAYESSRGMRRYRYGLAHGIVGRLQRIWWCITGVFR